MRLPTGLRALNHRDFRLFWFGQMISLIGSWMQTVGQSWLIVELTDSPFKLGLISTLQFAPMLLFSLFAGAAVDRLPKRRMLIITQTTLMLLALTLSALVYSGHIQYWHVAVMAVLLGTVNALDVPLRQSFVVEMVGKEDLGNAIALNSAIFNGGRLIGPAAAGLLIAQCGVATAFLINGISFLAVIAALLGIRAQGLPRPRTGRSMIRDIREGIAFVWRTPKVRLLLSLLLFTSLFVINYSVLVPVLAREGLQMGAEGYGLLMSSLGAGALTGAIVLAFQGRQEPPFAMMLAAVLTLCGATLATGFIRSLGLAMALLFLTGFSQILFTAACNTTVQINSPDELRGRVMSLYSLVFAGVAPFGAFFTGTVTEAYGPWTGYLVDGGLGLASVLLLLLWWRFAHRASPSVSS